MKQPITNDTPNVMFVAGKLIPPGETRFVEVRESSNKTPAFNPSELLAQPVSKLPEALDMLTLDKLNQALAYEQSHEKRKGAISAIEKLIEAREYDAELSEFASSLSSTEDLDQLLLMVDGDESKVAMIEEEKARRQEQMQNDNQ